MFEVLYVLVTNSFCSYDISISSFKNLSTMNSQFQFARINTKSRGKANFSWILVKSNPFSSRVFVNSLNIWRIMYRISCYESLVKYLSVIGVGRMAKIFFFFFDNVDACPLYWTRDRSTEKTFAFSYQSIKNFYLYLTYA